MPFNGAAPTDTQFKTVEINRQYDGFADFPLYPLNLISTVNALLGVFYVHAYGLDVSMAPDAPTSPIDQGTHGDTSYYFFDTPDLPFFGPMRTFGVPEKLIDVVEPLFRVIVELGYDRSIPAWEPTTARLFPKHDPAKVTADLTAAIREGIDNARALFNLPPLPGSQTTHVPATPAAAHPPVADTHGQMTQSVGNTPAATTTSSTPATSSPPGTDPTQSVASSVTLTHSEPSTVTRGARQTPVRRSPKPTPAASSATSALPGATTPSSQQAKTPSPVDDSPAAGPHRGARSHGR